MQCAADTAQAPDPTHNLEATNATDRFEAASLMYNWQANAIYSTDNAAYATDNPEAIDTTDNAKAAYSTDNAEATDTTDNTKAAYATNCVAIFSIYNFSTRQKFCAKLNQSAPSTLAT